MINLKSKSLIAFYSLFLAVAFAPALSFGAPSCRSLLEKSTETEMATPEEDRLSIEILAAISLAVSLGEGKYKSVPRIRLKDRGSYSFEDFLLSKISGEDRIAILRDLMPQMMNTLNGSGFFSRLSKRIFPEGVNLFLTQSPLRKDFNERFDVRSMEERMKRHEGYIENFLDLNFDAIVFNAANASRRSRAGQTVFFMKRSLKYVLIGVIGGSVLETLSPNIFFKEVDLGIVQDAFRYAVNEMPFWQKAGINGAALAAPARVISVPVNFMRRILRGWRNVEVGTFEITEYNAEIGKEVRDSFVDPQEMLED